MLENVLSFIDAIGRSRGDQNGSNRERRIDGFRQIVCSRSSTVGCNPYTWFRRIIVGRVSAENDSDQARRGCGPKSENAED
jgi:hypothetical protein